MSRNKNSIQMGYQSKNPFVCCLFIFIYIFVSRSFPLPSAFLSTDIERGKVFGANTLRRRKIQPETALPPDLAVAVSAIRYLCIRASETGGWRNGHQLYHRLLPLSQEKNNVIGFPFLAAQISFITNCLNKILSLLHILNAMAITISRL